MDYILAALSFSMCFSFKKELCGYVHLFAETSVWLLSELELEVVVSHLIRVLGMELGSSG